ncbi:MAG TPA: dihydroorotate dehydrogenase [Nitrososphaeraceae archaeon]|nr:dihydroorotate dehydrogenase [Nitrososphaeraceae archaeon]
MRREQHLSSSSLSVSFAGICLRNPTMLASGFLGISMNLFRRLYKLNVGAIVSKSISTSPIEGYRNPTIVSLNDSGYLNAVGLANPGADAFSEEIRENDNLPILVSLVGSSDKDFPSLVKKFDRLNIIGYEINLSCPHVAKMGMEVGDDPEMVYRIVKATKSYTNKPVFVKVGVGNADVLSVASIAKDAGADGITAINTLRAMVIDIETGMPILSNKIGGLSGKPIKPLAIRCVYEITKRIEIPVIACGGIFNWKDAVEAMLAGASAVQLGSVIATEGLSSFYTVCTGIQTYLKRKNVKSVMEIIGLAHKF